MEEISQSSQSAVESVTIREEFATYTRHAGHIEGERLPRHRTRNRRTSSGL